MQYSTVYGFVQNNEKSIYLRDDVGVRTLLDLVRIEKGELSNKERRDIRGKPEEEELLPPPLPLPPRSTELMEG